MRSGRSRTQKSISSLLQTQISGPSLLQPFLPHLHAIGAEPAPPAGAKLAPGKGHARAARGRARPPARATLAPVPIPLRPEPWRSRLPMPRRSAPSVCAHIRSFSARPHPSPAAAGLAPAVFSLQCASSPQAERARAQVCDTNNATVGEASFWVRDSFTVRDPDD